MTNKTFFDMTADLLTNHEDRIKALEEIKGYDTDDVRDIAESMLDDALNEYVQESDLESKLEDYLYYNEYIDENKLEDRIVEYARNNDLVSANEVEDIVSNALYEQIGNYVDTWAKNVGGDIIDNAIADRLACFTAKLERLYSRVFPEQTETAEGGNAND